MTMRVSTARLVLVVAAAVGGGVPCFGAPPATKPARAEPAIPLLSDATVAEIRALAKGRPYADFTGKGDHRGRSQQAYVSSARGNVAYESALAEHFKRKFDLPPAKRADVLIVSCGDSGAVLGYETSFNCVDLQLITSRGVVAPLSYKATNNAYKSEEGGSSWRVREIEATYPIDGLRFGFSVKYRSPDGHEWSFNISPGDAQQELLLNLRTAPAK